MVGLFLFGLLCVICLLISGSVFQANNERLGLLLCIIGAFLLIIFSFISADIIRFGEPKINIYPGEYKVAFLYQAGNNVSLGLEIKGEKEEHLYFYQFKKQAFEGEIKNSAKKLVVIEGDGFKKLRLE